MWPKSDVLSPEQQRAGFRVLEDDRFVYIERLGQMRLAFSKSGETRESIQQAVESLREERKH